MNDFARSRRSLDFGCGVGRVAISLARVSTSVLGVDISPGMIAEAEKNARERGVDNVAFAHMVPRQDPHALADALRLILQNPEMATTLGQAGRRKVVENYDWKHQITAMNQILSAACGVPSAGDTVGKL